jgi:NAD(P)H-hydrate epimerase
LPLELAETKLTAMPVPVLTVAQMRAWEAASWQAGRTESEVIARVGQLLAARLRALSAPGERILVLAGRGHNGDDARAAAGQLRDWGDRQIDLIEVNDPRSALSALNSALSRRPAWVVDGLFGIGLNRPLSPEWTHLIQAVNASKRPVLAVDVPSGLNAQTGETWGTAVKARLTVTVGAPKVGLLRPEAWPYTGRLVVEPEIGLVPVPQDAELWWTLPEDFTDFPPPAPVTTHKGHRGHLLIFAGSRGYHGAAVLAARAAQRARPGLITVGTMPEVYVPVASQLQAVMVDDWRAVLAKLPRATACLIGPGLASSDVPADLREMAVTLWQTAPIPVIVDASALDWLPRSSAAAPALRVITPHPGEAARLLGCSVLEIQHDRPAALRALSKSFGESWVVLKGFQTLVGQHRGTIWVNSSGDGALAQGGTGDILAGYLAGFLAQPDLISQTATTIRYAVWRHGHASDSAEAVGHQCVPEELLDCLAGKKAPR